MEENSLLRRKHLEVMTVNLLTHLQVHIKQNAQYVTWYFVIHMNQHVVAKASATHAVNESNGIVAVAHVARMTNLKSENIRA